MTQSKNICLTVNFPDPSGLVEEVYYLIHATFTPGHEAHRDERGYPTEVAEEASLEVNCIIDPYNNSQEATGAIYETFTEDYLWSNESDQISSELNCHTYPDFEEWFEPFFEKSITIKRRKVVTIAKSIKDKDANINWSLCMKRAWTAVKCYTEAKLIKFEKKDGTICKRVVSKELVSDIHQSLKTGRKLKPNQVLFVDISKLYSGCENVLISAYQHKIHYSI